jgi:hypothetical protein
MVGVKAPEPELISEKQRLLHDLQMFRGRLHDVSDERFEGVVLALRQRRSISSIARELIEEGFCAHLSPSSVRTYLAKLRDALGLPGYAAQQAELEKLEKEEEAAGEPIEGQPALNRLRWLTRKQQTRVRKALKLEGMMGDKLLPIATSQIKLMGDLLEKNSRSRSRPGS